MIRSLASYLVDRKLFPLVMMVAGGITKFSAAGEVNVLVHPSDDDGKPEQTYVYSALVQSSWDRLNEMHGGAPKKVAPPNALITALDTTEWDEKSVMPKSGWKTWQGKATQELVDTAISEGQTLLPAGAEPPGFRLLEPDPNNLAVFALLYTDVRFEKAFFESKKSGLTFTALDGSQSEVRFFGTAGKNSDSYKDSVSVLAYDATTKEHALQVRCRGRDEKVVLFRPAEYLSVGDALARMAELRRQFDKGIVGVEEMGWEERMLKQAERKLNEGDEVRIPYLDLKFDGEFADRVAGARYFKNEDIPWRISQLTVAGRFELFEKGARLRAEVSLGDAFGGKPPHPEPRQFTYDAPFYVFLWREGADRPYFAAWIGDASGMTKFGK